MAMRDLSTTDEEEREALILPDDILICILIRLDKRDIVRYQCVCKRWKDLTSQQQFLTSYQQFLSSMMDEPRSIFIAVRRTLLSSYPISFIRLETPPSPPPQVEVVVHDDDDDASSLPPPPLNDTNFLGHVPRLLPGARDIIWGFPLPTTTSPEMLYMFSESLFVSLDLHSRLSSLPGISLNLTTNDCQIFLPPGVDIVNNLPATVGDSIYFISPNNPISIVRYNTESNSWYIIPYPPQRRKYKYRRIYGTAVLNDDIILFNTNQDPLAYVVSKNKWCHVKDPHHLSHNILGQAVVVKDIIFAFEVDSYESIVKFDLKPHLNGEGIIKYFTCHLLMDYECVVPSLEKATPAYRHWSVSKSLVHLGEDYFCALHICNNIDDADSIPDHQYIQHTYIKLSHPKVTVTDIRVHGFKVPPGDRFIITHCFSLPKSKFNALEEDTALVNREQEADFVAQPSGLPLFMKKYSSKEATITVGQIKDLETEDTTPEVHEDASKISSASEVATKGNVPSIASTISAVIVTEASTLGDFAVSGKSDADEKKDLEAKDTTPEVHEDASKKSSASEVATKGNVPTIASTISAVTVTEASNHGDVVVSGKIDADEKKGHFICVRNLPPDLRLDELVKELKKFGPLKFVLIHPEHSQTSWVALVEFESATSKQNAIKGSPITIGDRTSVIEENSGSISLFQCDSNMTSCSSSSAGSNNKVKNHSEEDSRYKTTSDGHNTGKKSRNRHRRAQK